MRRRGRERPRERVHVSRNPLPRDSVIHGAMMTAFPSCYAHACGRMRPLVPADWPVVNCSSAVA